jgi:putative transposase
MDVYHVTIIAAERRPIFMWDPNPRILLEVLFDSQEQGRYLLHEFVVLPDQVQVLITPARGASAESAAEFIRQEFSNRIGGTIETPVWERAFTAQRVEDDRTYKELRHAIHLSPVRAGLAVKPSQYPFSSASPAFAPKLANVG